jgi:hypothetical protein
MVSQSLRIPNEATVTVMRQFADNCSPTTAMYRASTPLLFSARYVPARYGQGHDQALSGRERAA